jgi:O-antigen/teichoic acid export membrane protein
MVNAIYPAASRLWAERPAAARDAVERGARLLVAASLPVCALFWVHGGLVLGVLFPREYGSAAEPLALLGFSLIPFGISTLSGVLLYAAGRQWMGGAALIGAGVVTVALSLVLVPRLGGVGTAWTRLAWTSVNAALCLLFTRRLEAPLRPLRMLWRPVLAALPAFAVLVVLRHIPVLSIGAAAVVYAGMLWVTGVLRDDLRLRPAVTEAR